MRTRSPSSATAWTSSPRKTRPGFSSGRRRRRSFEVTVQAYRPPNAGGACALQHAVRRTHDFWTCTLPPVLGGRGVLNRSLSTSEQRWSATVPGVGWNDGAEEAVLLVIDAG